MKGPYCASRLDEDVGIPDPECLSGITDCIPLARRFPFTALNVYSILVGPQNSGEFVENSGGERCNARSCLLVTTLFPARGAIEKPVLFRTVAFEELSSGLVVCSNSLSIVLSRRLVAVSLCTFL